MALVRGHQWRAAAAAASYADARGLPLGDRRQTMLVATAAEAGQMDL